MGGASREPAEQGDGFALVAGIPSLLQSKDWSGKVDADCIAGLWSKLLRRRGHPVGVAFSRHGFTEAAITLARFVSPLRSLDALHLAVAEAAGLPLLTCDEKMHAAAKRRGIPGKLIRSAKR